MRLCERKRGGGMKTYTILRKVKEMRKPSYGFFFYYIDIFVGVIA